MKRLLSFLNNEIIDNLIQLSLVNFDLPVYLFGLENDVIIKHITPPWEEYLYNLPETDSSGNKNSAGFYMEIGVQTALGSKVPIQIKCQENLYFVAQPVINEQTVWGAVCFFYLLNDDHCAKDELKALDGISVNDSEIVKKQFQKLSNILGIRMQMGQDCPETELKLAQDILDNSIEPTFRINEAGIIVYANKAAVLLLETVNKNNSETKIWDLDQSLTVEKYKILWEILKKNNFQTEESVLPEKDNKKTYLEKTYFLINCGIEEYLVLVLHDITTRKELEMDLSAAENRFRLFMEYFPGLTYIKDHDLKIVFVNKGFQTLLGISSEEIIGKTNQEVFQGEFGAKINQEDLRVLRTGKPQILEEVFAGKIWKTYKFPMLDKNQKVLLGGITVDITDQKEAEKRNIDLQHDLNQVNKIDTLGKLAGGIAHDFNNMLTPIIGNAQIMEMDLPMNHPNRKWIQEIIKASDCARGLTRQLLAFARKQVLDIKPLNLNKMIQWYENLLNRTIRENITIQTHLQPNLENIEADEGQMEQILLNLAINSQDAMPEGGLLTIETSSVTVDDFFIRIHPEFSPGDYVVLKISDTGCGIPQNIIEHIYDPLFTTKEKGKGTGLGLSTVYGIVRQHRGYIQVESEIGKGTTFTIHFPIKPEPNQSIPDLISTSSDTAGNETILVVEDDERVMDIMVNILEKKGYNVLHALNGKEAMLNFSGHKIDLLVSDLIMPGINGKILSLKFKELQPELRTVFVSGYSNSVHGMHNFLDKYDEFIQKPFDIDDFLTVIRNVLDKQPR